MNSSRVYAQFISFLIANNAACLDSNICSWIAPTQRLRRAQEPQRSGWAETYLLARTIWYGHTSPVPHSKRHRTSATVTGRSITKSTLQGLCMLSGQRVELSMLPQAKQAASNHRMHQHSAGINEAFLNLLSCRRSPVGAAVQPHVLKCTKRSTTVYHRSVTSEPSSLEI